MSQRRSAWPYAVVLVTAIANSAPAHAVDECLTKPNKAVSPGEHWYYRYDGATKRRCWHLGEETNRRSRNATTGAGIETPNAPAARTPSQQPPAPVSAADTPASTGEPRREAIETATTTAAPPDSAEAPEPARAAGLLRWPDETSLPSASPAPAPTPTVVVDAQVTSSTAAPPQPASGLAPAAQHAEPPPSQPEALATTPAAPDIARHLVALVLAALALLLVARPISQLMRGRSGRHAAGHRVEQAPLSDSDSPTVSIRDILGRCDQATEPSTTPRDDVPAWPREIAQALQRLNGATEAYREGVRTRTPAPDVRASG